MAHAASRRRRLARDEAHYRLLHIRLDELRSLLFIRSADLANHDDRFGPRIIIQQLQCINVRCADDRVATNTDRRRLTEAARRQLINRLVRQRTRARDDANTSLFVNTPRHDADLRLARRDHTRTVRPDEPRLRVLHNLPHLHHVQHWNAFRDADHQRQPSISGFEDAVRSSRWRNEDHRRIRSGLLHRLLDGVEDRPALMRRPTFTWSHTANDELVAELLRILIAALRMEGAFATGNSLHDQPRVLVYENAHYFTPFAAATTRSAASFIVAPTWNFRPLSSMILRPSSTFVPSSRSTIGICTLSFFAAATTAVASTSTRRMPPKMLMKIAFTFLSESRMPNAFSICSWFAPPPTSRKLAGEPPAYWMMSIVAIARPAPFTMHAMLPSSLM